MTTRWRARLATAALAMTVGSAEAQPPHNAASAPASTAPAGDPFERLDLEFRGLYADARSATLGRIDPVILVQRDTLTLLRNGRREEVTVIPPVYHRLKSVAHVPLSLFVALAPHGTGRIDDARMARLRSFRSRIEEMASALESAGFGPDRTAQSRETLRRCVEFLDEVLAVGRYDPVKLAALTHGLGPAVLALAQDAAKAQIDAYHTRVSAWRRELSPEEWGRLRILVMGVAMPRKRNTAVQYFAKLLGLPGESRRLVYAEMLPDEPHALDLLATHQLDGELSQAFFADPGRMELDLLGNAAATYLDTLDLDP